MNATLRRYRPETDFLRIRDFLVSTYGAFDQLINWRLERWNYARYFVAPMLAHYGEIDPSPADASKAIHFWEETIGVWENQAQEIVGVVNIEHPDLDHPGFGEAFFQRHPRYPSILGEMLDYAEANLRNPRSNELHIYIYDHDAQFEALVRERGYRQDTAKVAHDSEFVIKGELPQAHLPAGHVIRSMAEDNDIERRRKIFGLGFNHRDPAEWPSACAYEELQRAPDYRKDLDLYLIAPDGEHVACCIVWWDSQNRLAVTEPVATHPDYKAVVLEGIRRAAALGATTVQVGSGQRFYEAIGFRKTLVSYRWAKQL
jgi:predicted N-acetyltransferase YhbS